MAHHRLAEAVRGGRWEGEVRGDKRVDKRVYKRVYKRVDKRVDKKVQRGHRQFLAGRENKMIERHN